MTTLAALFSALPFLALGFGLGTISSRGLAPRAVPAGDPSGVFVRLTDVETGAVVVIPFLAAAMARGLWLLRWKRGRHGSMPWGRPEVAR